MNDLASFFLSLSRTTKTLIVVFVDTCLCVFSVWIALYVRLGEFISLTGQPLIAAFGSIFILVPLFFLGGLYKSVFRYNGWRSFIFVAKLMFPYSLLFFTVFTVVGVPDVPRTIGVIQPIILFLSVVISRGLARFWLGDGGNHFPFNENTEKVMIYGAGLSGRQLASAISSISQMSVVGFLDDDETLQGRVLNGIPIFKPDGLEHLIKKMQVKSILLAMPSIGRGRRNSILSQMQSLQLAVRTLPSVSDIAQGKIEVSDIQELDIDDLLGREKILPDLELMNRNTMGKVVLVTGCGGSIGSELCRQIAKFKPRKLLLLEQNELALYNIQQELEERNQDVSLVPLLANIQDEKRLFEIFKAWLPDIVYHAAAYKHVPLVEKNFVDGVKNNIFGTKNVVETAIKFNVGHFVLVSTDKAVRPTNLMGATKRVAEMILQALSIESGPTILSMVRFGNVLGSSGSVVLKFREQIRSGGPVTITHPEMVRYFMSIPEAAQLVIQAGAMAKGGDVFVLNMGQPVKILDLARKMIELSGLTVVGTNELDGDIEIKITDMRPGEKLFEELLIGENPEPTAHEHIMKAHETYIKPVELQVHLVSLSNAINERSLSDALQIIRKCVPDYEPSAEILDTVGREQLKE